MKVGKQLKKLQDLLDDEAREQEHYRQELRDLLRKMKLKERKLSSKVELEADENERERMARKIDILHAQRYKGVQVLRGLKDESDQD